MSRETHIHIHILIHPVHRSRNPIPSILPSTRRTGESDLEYGDGTGCGAHATRGRDGCGATATRGRVRDMGASTMETTLDAYLDRAVDAWTRGDERGGATTTTTTTTTTDEGGEGER